MKTKFNLLDVIASVEDLKRTCIGLRAANFYDINKRTYLIKFGSGDRKVTILIEYGARIHSTNFTWTKNIFPSSFSMKCRKTIGNRRLSNVQQMGMDRIVDFTFGADDSPFHLIVELYDKGNLLLTDSNYMILSILRQRRLDEDAMLTTSQKYNMESIRHRQPVISLDELKNFISTCEEKSNLRKHLGTKFQLYGPHLIDHCLLELGFSKQTTITENFVNTEELNKLYDAIKLAEKILDDFTSGKISGGFITLKPMNEKDDPSGAKKFNDQFIPFLFNQYKSTSYKTFGSFSEAVDEFFSQIEEQKMEEQLITKENSAAQKVQNVIKDHEVRIQTLMEKREYTHQCASLIKENQKLVDDVILLINSALAKKITWPTLEGFIKDAKEEGHPLAMVIDYIKLETNQVAILLLPTSTEIDKSAKPHSVLVDLSLTASRNYQKYFDSRKTAMDKQERIAASQKTAIKSAKLKMNAVLKETKIQIRVKKNRKQYWFERYRWFISSDNYLVLAGREAQENEFLVKHHGGKNDIFVHADTYGSATVIIKVSKEQIQQNSEVPVPLRTLNEAATFAVCYSSCWDNHVTVPSYWVYMSQVSKTPETGEYLKVGGFVIRGKKNFIQSPNLILGIGMMFKLDAVSTEKHLADRLPKWNFDESSNSNTLISLEQASPDLSIDHSLSSDSEEHIKPSQEHMSHIVSENEEDINFPDNDNYINKLKEIEINTTVSDSNEHNLNEESEENSTKFKIGESTEGKKISDPTDDSDTEKNMPKIEEIKDYEKHDQTQKSKPESSKLTKDSISQIEKGSKSSKSSALKRGQRSKKKLIESKYKDQDEDERELAMKLLHVSLKPHTSKKSIKKEKEITEKQKLLNYIDQHSTEPKKKPNPQIKEKKEKPVPEEENLDISDKEDNTEEANLLSSFSGKPSSEDQLLFPVLICAPYSCLIDYKFKLKLTPGTTKRGRAVKTALSMFSAAKDASRIEIELMNSLKELDNTRNLPTSVKISAPHMAMKKNKQAAN